MTERFKPNKTSFVIWPLALTIAVSLLAFAICALVLNFLPLKLPVSLILLATAGVLLLINVFRWLSLKISFDKEEYEFRKDRIIARGGGIFSNYEQELLVRNVTHIVYNRPFFEHRLFKTGSIHIQSAGGSDIEVRMRSVDLPAEIYDKVLALLENNGFSVSLKQVVQEAHPAKMGVYAITLFYAGIALLVILGSSIGAIEDRSIPTGWPLYLIIALVSIGAILFVIYQYGIYNYRNYKMYTDAVIEETDFFGFTRILIPMKNLSDSALTQSIIARLLSLHDMMLSCQGSEQEINFYYLTGGEIWKQKLDQLLAQKNKLQAAAKESTKRPEADTWNKPIAKAEVVRDQTSTATITMDRRKLYFPGIAAVVIAIPLLVLGIIFLPDLRNIERPSPSQILGIVFVSLAALMLIAGLLRLLYGYVALKAFSYEIREQGFASRFKFISTKNVQFNAEKVTGIIFKEGVIDRLFGCYNVTFWSIGSSEPLQFKQIRKDPEQMAIILAKVGIRPKSKSRVVLCSPTPLNVFASEIFFMIAMCCVAMPVALFFHATALFALLVVVVVPFIFVSIYYRFHRLELFEDYLHFRKGILLHTHYYIRYDDIKYISSTAYPLGTAGKLTFDVTGEQMIDTGQGGKHKVSNRFCVRLVADVRFRHQLLDLLMAQNTKWEQLPESSATMANFDPRILTTSRPRWLHTFFIYALPILILDLIAIGVVIANMKIPTMNIGPFLQWGIIGLIILNALVFTAISVSIRYISYTIDTQKVSKSWGVFYPSRLSIHIKDIDYIGKKFGAINKLFSTGNIEVHTVGSGQTDLVIKHLPDVNKFYDVLQQQYRPE